MDDALTESKRRFAHELVSSRKLDIEPLIADQWVTISLLQKSIRRGEVETAQRAAFTLFAQKGSAIWRRFMVIAFEDVGAASPDAVAMTVAASTDSSWRRKNGGDLDIAVQLARVLAEAPKSRSAEHLITSAQHHPSLAKARMLRTATSLRAQLAAVMNQNASPDQVGPTYVSPILYENYTCPQLAEEAQRVSSAAARASGVQDQKATNDKVAMGVGLVVFWPVLLMTKGNDENTAELARLKGQMNAIEEASIRKRCGIRFQHAPPPVAQAPTATEVR